MNSKMIRIAVVATVAILALWPVSAPAYVLLGPRWVESPHITVTDSELSAETAQAASLWQAASGIRFAPDNGSWDLQIEVRYSTSLGDGLGGLSTLWYGSGSLEMRHCLIEINPNHWAGVVAHELGHCIGLAHSDVADSIMGTTYQWSADDAAAARYLYGPSPCRTYAGGLVKEE